MSDDVIESDAVTGQPSQQTTLNDWMAAHGWPADPAALDGPLFPREGHLFLVAVIRCVASERLQSLADRLAAWQNTINWDDPAHNLRSYALPLEPEDVAALDVYYTCADWRGEIQRMLDEVAAAAARFQRQRR